VVVAAGRTVAEAFILGEEVTAAPDLMAKAAPGAAVMAVNPLEDRKNGREEWVGAHIAGPKTDAARDYPKTIRRTSVPPSMMASGTRSATPEIPHEPPSRLATL